MFRKQPLPDIDSLSVHYSHILLKVFTRKYFCNWS